MSYSAQNPRTPDPSYAPPHNHATSQNPRASDPSNSSDLSETPLSAPSNNHITSQEFAAALPDLRPKLHSFLRHTGRYDREDAEDLVEEAITVALEHLAQFRVPNPQPSTLNHQLFPWLRGILKNVVRRFHQSAQGEPPTVPIEAAEQVPSAAEVSRYDVLMSKMHLLPPEQHWLVRDWFNGYSQADLAREHRIHRNTVATRLQLAFAALGTDPDADRLTYSTSMFDKHRRRIIYRKPPGMHSKWLRTLPRDIKFVLESNTEFRERSDRALHITLRRIAA